MFRYGGEDVVTGRPGSISVPEGEIPPLPIPLIPHLTDNEAGIVDTARYLSGPTQGVGLLPLHVEVQKPEGLYLVQGKVEGRHGENRRCHVDLLLRLRILPVFSSFPSIRLLTNPSHHLIRTASPSPRPYRRSRKLRSPAPPPSSRSLAATCSSSSFDPPLFLLGSP